MIGPFIFIINIEYVNLGGKLTSLSWRTVFLNVEGYIYKLKNKITLHLWFKNKFEIRFSFENKKYFTKMFNIC